MTVYTQCATTNGGGFVYVPSTASGDVTKAVTCDGGWEPTTVDFTTASNATTFSFYVYSDDTAPLFVDDATLTYADGTVPPQTEKHAGAREAALSGNHLTVDGQPYLALGFYSIPFGELAAAADAGANTVIDMGSAGDCFATAQEVFLDRAYELNVLPDSTFTARLQTAAVFPAVAARFAPTWPRSAGTSATSPTRTRSPSSTSPRARSSPRARHSRPPWGSPSPRISRRDRPGLLRLARLPERRRGPGRRPAGLRRAVEPFAGDLRERRERGLHGPGGDLVRSAQGGHTWLFAVDPTSSPVSGQFTGPKPTGGSQVNVLFENRSVTVFNGGFADSFTGVSRHIYQLQ
ncbi:MAG: hypothetical protein ACYDCL_00500 [Myxococcales bacterium]